MTISKTDNRKQFFNREKIPVSLRENLIVRLSIFLLFLLQRIEILLSGLCPHTPQEIKNSKESFIIYYNPYGLNSLIVITKEMIFLRGKNLIVRFSQIFNLTLKAWFFCFLLSGIFIVRFSQICNLTIKQSIVRFLQMKLLTFGGSMNAETW